MRFNFKKNYTNDDLKLFRNKSKQFYIKHCEEIGLTGITNYLHMFGCDHMLCYMERYSNLYRYSQQGWEGLNAKIKSIFLQHTSKGGGNILSREAALHLNSM